MAKDLEAIAKTKKIKYFLVSWVDLFGNLRAKLVPARAIKGMQKDGAGFAGFAAWLDMTPAHPDLFAIPDADSLIQLPWKPEIGWVAADLWMDGKEVEASPRVALKRQLAKAMKKGYRMKTGVECEYHLITPDGKALADPADTQSKPCYDQQALMRQYPVIGEICDSMLKLGWNPYQNDHEDANGQFEMNWDYDDALQTADKHVFFKYMVKTIAENHGMRATFMPKPFTHLTGNGCHAHVSLWDRAGKKNLFATSGKDARSLGLSALAYKALGGIMHSASEQLQAHQRTAYPVGCNLVAQCGDLWRQQSHAHDPRARRWSFRVAPHGWCGESLSAAGRSARRGTRWYRQQARSRRSDSPEHVRGRAQGQECEKIAG
jgi:glutamine synthetase